MIGLVVWSNEARGHAVIWCEDQGALAYLDDPRHLTASVWPQAGDLLHLETEQIGAVRYARNVTLMQERVMPDLQNKLLPPQPRQHLRLVASKDNRAPAPVMGAHLAHG